MAVRQEGLDEKIIQAAREEFLAKGFGGATLHTIAHRAGVTTGAIYTRYQSKDDLFRSLLKDALEDLESHLTEIAQSYKDVPRTSEGILAAIRQEERIYLDILMRHYDASVLFFCRSGGSSAEQTLLHMRREKSRKIVDFLRTITDKPINALGIQLLLEGSFYYYRQVLESGMSMDHAQECMYLVEKFMNAGWQEIFSQIL